MAYYYQIHPYLKGDFRLLEFDAGLHRRYEYKLLGDAISGPLLDLLIGRGAGSHWVRWWFRDISFGFHNFYVELIWEKGLIGAVLFVLAVTGFFVGIVRRRPSLQASKYFGLVRWAYEVLSFIMFMSLTQNRLGSFKHTAIIGVLLGLPYAAERVGQATGAKKHHHQENKKP